MSILGIINQWNLHLRTADPHPVGRALGKQEIMRLTAGSCLARLVRFSPSSIQRVMEKFSFKDMVSSLVKHNPREQQICLNILNMTLVESHTLPSVGRYLLALVEDKNLVLNLLILIEQGSEVFKGKGTHIFCSTLYEWEKVAATIFFAMLNYSRPLMGWLRRRMTL